MAIERLEDDPSGTKVAVNGVNFVVAHKTEQIGCTTGAVPRPPVDQPGRPGSPQARA